MSRDNLRARKQELVRNTIFDAAIEMFATKGFDETTVEEVAQAAGVSRRSFFRYFASKDDLLAQNVLNYGLALREAITGCPPAFTPLEVLRETVLSVGKQSSMHPHTRRIIEIAHRSATARQAHHSRWIEVEDGVAQAFAGRLKSASKDDLKPRLMASLTLSVANVAIIAWYRGEFPDFSSAAKHAISNLIRFTGDQTTLTKASRSVAPGRALVSPAVGRKRIAIGDGVR